MDLIVQRLDWMVRNGFNFVMFTEFLDNALRSAKEKASDERERRQVADLTSAAAYWRMAAGALALDLRAKTAEKEGDRATAASLLNQVSGESERVHEYLKTMSRRGWISIATPPQGRRLAANFRKRAGKLT